VGSVSNLVMLCLDTVKTGSRNFAQEAFATRPAGLVKGLVSYAYT